MDLDRVIEGRRSIRKYRERDIPDAVVEELIDLARHAPCSMNGQPWIFIVVRDGATKDRLAEIKDSHCPVLKQAFEATMLRQAPVVIVVCVDRERSYDRGLENGVLATANLLLAAHSRGLGSVYMSASKADEPRLSEEIRTLLGIPSTVDPITLLPLGVPDETPPPRALPPLESIICHEIFSRD